jgi:lipopolysaccharide transport system ATP-binding protein
MTSKKDRPIIEVKNLSKQYQIGVDRTYKTLSESVMTGFRHPIRTLRALRAPSDTFQALRDVNFEVEPGEVLGIIGRNGAGKSTLLKVLSRITYPTEGEIVMRGRVGSLLEVGTGFHPELTGRENIYFNGAILGMKKREIDDKFEEIVKFSGVEKFLDTPVKRYSSGMNVRLAFSVAAHLEPEILLVDEVLAVGDAEFQKKCLGKMGEVASEGRTVLFVSHNMAAVSSLCNRAILLNSGQINSDGPTDEILSMYLDNQNNQGICEKTFDCCKAPGNNRIKLLSVTLHSGNGEKKSTFCMDEPIYVKIKYQTLETVMNFHLYLIIHTVDGILAFASADWDTSGMQSGSAEPGMHTTTCEIPPYLLNAGIFKLSLNGLIPDICFIFKEADVLQFEVRPSRGAGGFQSTERKGIFRPLLKWT